MKIKSSGFTFIEIMVVVIILAILAATAIPAYQAHIRRAHASVAQQEMLRISALLERHKARNFSYKGFATNEAVIPEGATGAEILYDLELVDGSQTTLSLNDDEAAGRSWAMQAISTDPKNDSFLLTSTGVRCKNKTSANITFATCGTAGSEPW